MLRLPVAVPICYRLEYFQWSWTTFVDTNVRCEVVQCMLSRQALLGDCHSSLAAGNDHLLPSFHEADLTVSFDDFCRPTKRTSELPRRSLMDDTQRGRQIDDAVFFDS